MSQRAGNARLAAARTPGMWPGSTGVTLETPPSISCSNAAKTGPAEPATPKFNFVPLPGTRLRLEQRVRGGQGLLEAVWSRREASYFRRWLTEQDDDSAEALGPDSSYGFGLCSPADFAVSVGASSISQQLRIFPEQNKRGR